MARSITLKYLCPVISQRYKHYQAIIKIGYLPVRGRPECDFSHLGWIWETGVVVEASSNQKYRKSGAGRDYRDSLLETAPEAVTVLHQGAPR